MDNRLRLLSLAPLIVAMLTLPGCSNDNNASPPTSGTPTTGDTNGGRSSTDSTPSDRTTDSSDKSQTTTSGTAATTASGATADDGCWVQFYDDDNFDETDHNFRLTTPGRYGNLRSLPGANLNWTGEADSIRVGPSASITVWEHTDFRGSSEILAAGSEHPDLRHEPSSLEMACS